MNLRMCFQIWEELIGKNEESKDYRINLFMAVPTIYAKLLDYYETQMVKECGTMTRAFVKSIIKENIRYIMFTIYIEGVVRQTW